TGKFRSNASFDPTSAMGGVIRQGFLEANYRLACFRVPQSFPGEPFDSFGVAAQSINGSFEAFAAGFLLLNLAVEQQDSLSHPFVLLNEGQITNRDTPYACQSQADKNDQGRAAPEHAI